MLALSLICRVLLFVLVSASVHTPGKSPVLISESMWPQGCVLDCTRGRHREVCGSNGRFYKSLCAFQRAQCINGQLRVAPRTHCIDSVQSKCQLARTQALESSSRVDTAAVFFPECNADGTFLQVQCHSQTGYCWCSTPDGKPVSGTSLLHQRPNCTGQVSQTALLPGAETSQREGGSKPKPTLDSGAHPTPYDKEITAPPFWVTILLNSDPKGNRYIKRPTDAPRTCDREREVQLAENQPSWREDRFVPECTPEGRYNPVQCHGATGYCWCVRVDTGRPLPGTSARNRLPDCVKESPAGQPDRSYRDRPLPGCPGARKREFLQSLVRALQLEAQQAGDMLFSRGELDAPHTVTESTLPNASSSPLGTAEGALQRHFIRLDVDGNGVLSEREARPLRLYLRRQLRPRRCAKKFTQYCDVDGDHGLMLSELTACLAP